MKKIIKDIFEIILFILIFLGAYISTKYISYFKDVSVDNNYTIVGWAVFTPYLIVLVLAQIWMYVAYRKDYLKLVKFKEIINGIFISFSTAFFIYVFSLGSIKPLTMFFLVVLANIFIPFFILNFKSIGDNLK
jgi:hypothetical protein